MMTATKKEIRVLTINQPYADQILYGDKWCENRTWRTNYRGTLYIHANRWSPHEPKGETPGNGVVGAIIGKVVLAECLDYYEQVWPYWRRQFGDLNREQKRPLPRELETIQQFSEAENWTPESYQHACGDYCFVLTNREPLEKPIPAKGKLNIWKHHI